MFRFTYIFLLVLSTLHAKSLPDVTFPNWKGHYKLNPKPFHSESHTAYVDIYVNDIAKDAYIKEKELFPVGSMVFKPLFSDPEGKEFARLVVMVKMRPGYDRENGDWWYGVYDETGRVAFHQGRIQSCIDCHKEAKDTDYMFSLSVNAEIKRMQHHRKRK